jgi:hypothetical protein
MTPNGAEIWYMYMIVSNFYCTREYMHFTNISTSVYKAATSSSMAIKADVASMLGKYNCALASL